MTLIQSSKRVSGVEQQVVNYRISKKRYQFILTQESIITGIKNRHTVAGWAIHLNYLEQVKAYLSENKFGVFRSEFIRNFNALEL